MASVFGVFFALAFLGVAYFAVLAGALSLTGVFDFADDGLAAAFAGFLSEVFYAFTGVCFLAEAGDLLVFGGFFCLPNSFASAFGLASFESLPEAVFLTSLVGFSLDYDGFFLASFSSLAFFCAL